GDQRGVPGADAVPGPGRAGRGPARRRDRVRGRVQVPRPDQVRAAGLDGLEGRHRPGTRRGWCQPGWRGRLGAGMSEYAPGTTAQDAGQDPAPAPPQDGAAAHPYPAMAGRELTPEHEDLLEALRDVVDP